MQANVKVYSTFETSTCTGCRTCEIACSYHHHKVFNTGISSIEIMPREEKLAFDIRIYKEGSGKHFACDGCVNEEEPFCIRYCPLVAKDELHHIIQEFQKEAV